MSQLPALDERLDDVRAVLDAAGSDRAVLVGVSEGGPLCTLFAATYPHKTDAVVMIGSYARRLKDADYPWGLTREAHEAFLDGLLERWGGPVGIEDRAPTLANDPRFREWWATYLRMGASPGAAVALTRMNAQIDVRDVLPAVQAPTLVIHRTGDRCLPVEGSRYIAAKIPGATMVELPGDDHLPFVGNQDEILDAIARFLATLPSRAARDRVLATVLAIESDCRQADREHLQRVFAREVAAYRGRLVRGDGPLIAQFDGPGRAVRCGRIVANVAARSAIAVRGGIHIGECDPSGPDDPLLETCVALAASAAPGDVLVSRTVVDLVHGSGLVFADRGTRDISVLGRSVPVLAVERT